MTKRKKDKTKRKSPHPTIKAAVLCDQAIREEGTRKWSLIGTWNIMGLVQKLVPEKTAIHPQLAIYYRLADCLGDYSWTIELIHLGEETELLGELKGGFNSKDPLSHVEFAINIKAFPVTKTGKFIFRLSTNDKMVCDTEFWVKHQKP